CCLSLSAMAACRGVCTRQFITALCAEFLAVFLFMVVCLGSTLAVSSKVEAEPFTHIALCFEFTITILVHSFGHICEACLNPAVTLAMALTRKITIAKGFLYMVVQCLAAFTGTAVLLLFRPKNVFGVTQVSTDILASQALFIEAIISFQLVFMVFASCDRNRKDLRAPPSLIIGLSVTTGHLFAVRILHQHEPARSLGPSLIFQQWENHWVYWVGPVMGAVAAGFLYEFLFCPEPEVKSQRRVTFPLRKPEEKEMTEMVPSEILEHHIEIK
ncbi:AQP4 protein, partial [Atractosteus spatula]|nr:AQP4 protein [Atractosteus spatula]